MLGVSWYVLAVHLTSQLPMDVLEGLQQNIVVSYSIQMGIGMRQEAAIPPWPEGTGASLPQFCDDTRQTFPGQERA